MLTTVLVRLRKNELKFSHKGLCISAISAISHIQREMFLTVYSIVRATYYMVIGSEFFYSSDREISAPSPGPEEEIL